MDTKEPFAEHRKNAGLTIDQVAEELGVDRTTVMRWEKGDPKIPFKRLDAAADLLNVRKIDLRPDILEGAA